MKISFSEYYLEVIALAEMLIQEAKDEHLITNEEIMEYIDDRISEVISYHEYIIYSMYNLDVYNHSKNFNHFTESFGKEYAGQVLAEQGLGGLHQTIAHHALLQDVMEKSQEILEDE